MKKITLYENPFPRGSINPVSSKSMSNRFLIINALSNNQCKAKNLSHSNDTETLAELLNALHSAKDEIKLDAGIAGTVLRFLVTYCCVSGKHVILTGNERMKNRPIGDLVDALRLIGAKIDYLENNGFPPIKINPSVIKGGKVKIKSGTSSQFVSSLMLCAPYFLGDTEIELEGRTVSPSYIEMTKDIMQEFGASIKSIGNRIQISKGNYIPTEIEIEGDWSSASYFYSLASLSKQAMIELRGMDLGSKQGDKFILEISKEFGVKTIRSDSGIIIAKDNSITPKKIHFNFNACPDIAQTVAIMASGNGVAEVKLSGLSTLKIKETDRIKALQDELEKYKIQVTTTGDSTIVYDARLFVKSAKPLIETFHDHRMAMSFAPLAQKTGVISIQNPEVVRKSYINFWNDLKMLGCLYEIHDI